MKSSNQHRGGFTLVEVIVSFAIFAVLGTIVAQFIKTYASYQLKDSVNGDVDRALSLTAGRLETLLRGCRVVTPGIGDTVATLEFVAPEIDANGLIVVTGTGDPSWLPSQEVTLVDGKLVISGATPVLIGNLGPSGAVSFERSGSRVLRASLTAGFNATEAVVRKSANLRISLAVVP